MQASFNFGGSALLAGASVIGAAIEALIDSTNNRIFITLDKESYVSGDVVNGIVHIHCLVPFFAAGVLLKVKGYERAHFSITEQRYDEEKKKHVESTRSYFESNHFFTQVIRVFNGSGNIIAGTYTYPFSYQLPETLPGSFYDHGKHNEKDFYTGSIIYKLKATIDVQAKHNLHQTVCLVVNERIGGVVTPSYAENDKSFLTSSGRLKCKTWLDKTTYFPGETVVAKLEANNTSQKLTRSIEVMVVREITLAAQGQRFSRKFVVYKQCYPGFEELFYGNRFLPFYIPINLLPSTSSNLVKSSYQVVINCDIPGAIDLSCKLPLVIAAPQFLFLSAPPQPEGAPLPPDTSFRPPYQKDSQASACTSCSTSFTLFLRRHHCRHCLKIFCNKCTSEKIPLPNLGYSQPERVCVKCKEAAIAGGSRVDLTLAHLVPLGPAQFPELFLSAAQEPLGKKGRPIPRAALTGSGPSPLLPSHPAAAQMSLSMQPSDMSFSVKPSDMSVSMQPSGGLSLSVQPNDMSFSMQPSGGVSLSVQPTDMSFSMQPSGGVSLSVQPTDMSFSMQQSGGVSLSVQAGEGYPPQSPQYPPQYPPQNQQYPPPQSPQYPPSNQQQISFPLACEVSFNVGPSSPQM